MNYENGPKGRKKNEVSSLRIAICRVLRMYVHSTDQPTTVLTRTLSSVLKLYKLL